MSWESPVVHRKRGFSWRENVEDIKMAERKQNMALHMEEIDETRGSWRTNIIS